GLNAAGTAALGNFDGIGVSLGGNNTVGGAAAGARNVVSGNRRTGVSIGGGGAQGDVVQGNHIGTDPPRLSLISNVSFGVTVGDAVGALVADNVIAGTKGQGINFTGNNNHDNVVQGNFVGTDKTGNALLGNLDLGIYLHNGGAHNTIGGTAA